MKFARNYAHVHHPIGVRTTLTPLPSRTAAPALYLHSYSILSPSSFLNPRPSFFMCTPFRHRRPTTNKLHYKSVPLYSAVASRTPSQSRRGREMARAAVRFRRLTAAFDDAAGSRCGGGDGNGEGEGLADLADLVASFLEREGMMRGGAGEEEGMRREESESSCWSDSETTKEKLRDLFRGCDDVSDDVKRKILTEVEAARGLIGKDGFPEGLKRQLVIRLRLKGFDAGQFSFFFFIVYGQEFLNTHNVSAVLAFSTPCALLTNLYSPRSLQIKLGQNVEVPGRSLRVRGRQCRRKALHCRGFSRRAIRNSTALQPLLVASKCVSSGFRRQTGGARAGDQADLCGNVSILAEHRVAYPAVEEEELYEGQVVQ